MAMHNPNIHPQFEQSIFTDLDSLTFTPKPEPIISCSSESESKSDDETTVRSSSISPQSSIVSKSMDNIKRMIIFDWDDTLFPTFECVDNKKQMNIKTLNNWGCRVYKLLKKYIETFGAENIYIITNAAHGWIQDSLQMASELFQELNKYQTEPFEYDYFRIIDILLTVHKIQIISARSSYQATFPDPKHSKIWKQFSFVHHAIKHFWNEHQGVIISIGDSYDEWQASEHCQDFFMKYNTLCKPSLQRIKCKYEPTLDELMTEWESLISLADKLKLKNNSFDHHDLLLLKSEINEKVDPTIYENMYMTSNPRKCVNFFVT